MVQLFDLDYKYARFWHLTSKWGNKFPLLLPRKYVIMVTLLTRHEGNSEFHLKIFSFLFYQITA